MNIGFLLTCLLQLLVMLLGTSTLAIAQSNQDDPTGPMSELDGPRIAGLIHRAVEHVELEEKIEGALFKCYREGQPTLSVSERAEGSTAAFRKVCNKESFTSNPSSNPTGRSRRHQHERTQRQVAEQPEGELEDVQFVAADLNENEGGKTLYELLAMASFTTPGQNATPVPTKEAICGNDGTTCAASENAAAVQDGENNFSMIYDGLTGYAPGSPRDDDEEEELVLTSIGNYFFGSGRLENFLSTWKKTDENAEFFITKKEVRHIQHKATAGTLFNSLSRTNKHRFARLVFVRNALEVYALMRAVDKPLGFAFTKHMTGENFLQAMHGYLMAVNDSNGELSVPFSVVSSILSVEIFSLAYADCLSARPSITLKGKEMELREVLVDKMHFYIKNLVILFEAWNDSSDTDIDPAVLAKKILRTITFTRSDRDYDDGCKPKALE